MIGNKIARHCMYSTYVNFLKPIRIHLKNLGIFYFVTIRFAASCEFLFLIARIILTARLQRERLFADVIKHLSSAQKPHVRD